MHAFRLALVICIFATSASAQIMNVARKRIAQGGDAAGMVNLPYYIQDNQGNNWMIYQNGMLQLQGNFPLYSQGAMLTVNGQQGQTNNNQAKLDQDTGEIVFENMNVSGVVVTRRISVDKDLGMAKYIDIIKNPQANEVKVALRINSTLNYGVQQAQNVDDSKKEGNTLGWVGMTQAGRAVVEVFAGSGSKVTPKVNWPQGSNNVMANLQLTIPAGKEVAWLHMHGGAATQDAGVQLINELNPTKILASIPKEYRKLIINFPGGQSIFGELEILRGDVLDVIEVRGGDQLKGTLKDASLKLITPYGPVEVPVEKALALLSVGQFRPRHLIGTADGEMFGGTLDATTLSFELSSGQVMAIPVSQITRIGLRKRDGEPDEFNFRTPMVILKGGDRLAIAAPTEPIVLRTRYGVLALPATSISSINFEPDEQPVHAVRLIDGTSFAALFASDTLSVKLASIQNDSEAALPAASLAMVQFAAPPAEMTVNTPTLSLINTDILVGTVSGDLHLDTTFDTLAVRGREIARITRVGNSPVDVQVTLWDRTIVSGQLQEADVPFKLACGADLKIPVALIREYTQPQPEPSAMVTEKIKVIVTELNSDDFKARDKAQALLIEMGPEIGPVLIELRAAQPPEAQERIDTILAAVKATGVTDPLPANANKDQIMLPND